MRLVKWNDLITAYEKDPKPSSKSFLTIIFLLILLVLIPLGIFSVQNSSQILKPQQQIEPVVNIKPVENSSGEIVPEVSKGLNFKSEDFNNDGAVNSLDYLKMFQSLINGDSTSENKSCPAVITKACNLEGTCQDFPGVCDVPEGWKVLSGCEAEQKQLLEGKSFSPTSIILGFKDEVSEQQALELVNKYLLTYEILGGSFDSLRAIAVGISENQVSEWICRFQIEDIVRYAEPNYIEHTN